MAYLTFADMRTATLAEFAAGISLGTADASDTNLASAIARFSQRLDDYTNDHFENENVTLTLAGDGSPRLLLPKRCTAVSSVAITDTAGTSTTQTSTAYRLHSSLYASGAKRLFELDYLELIYGAGGLTGYPFDHWNPYAWPCDANSIAVTGSFGWSATPGDVQRAVALMVYDHFKPIRNDLHRTQSFTTDSAAINLSASQPTGIPECDDILAAYKRVTLSAGIA